MGIGICITSEILKDGLFKKPIKQNKLFDAILAALKSSLPVELQKSVFSSTIELNCMNVELHPAEEPVEFTIDNGTLKFSAKTNSAGPGYHAYLVDTLETVERQLGLTWNWSDGSDDMGDETSFHSTRDFIASK